jgi:hypothetical protein
MSKIREIAQHIEDAQDAKQPGRLIPLHVGDRGDEDFSRRNRRIALYGLPSAGYRTPGIKLSWDEYPFASTLEGGKPPPIVSVRKVLLDEQHLQGSIIRWFYDDHGLVYGDCFFVRIIE